MKRALLLLLCILVAGFLYWHFIYSKQTGPIPQAMIVLDKGVSTSKKQQWIIAYNPEQQTQKDKVKIFVDDLSTWNLIQSKNTTYMALYNKRQGAYHLTWIGVSGERQIPYRK